MGGEGGRRAGQASLNSAGWTGCRKRSPELVWGAGGGCRAGGRPERPGVGQGLVVSLGGRIPDPKPRQGCLLFQGGSAQRPPSTAATAP